MSIAGSHLVEAWVGITERLTAVDLGTCGVCAVVPVQEAEQLMMQDRTGRKA